MDLFLLFVLAMVQNASFTWVSRTRNSANIEMHAVASVCSNTLWFAITVFIWSKLWAGLTAGDWVSIAITGFVYVLGTTLGAVTMMWILLRTEKGKSRVGAPFKPPYAKGTFTKIKDL